MRFSHDAMLKLYVVLHGWVDVRKQFCTDTGHVEMFWYDQSFGTLVVLSFVKTTRVAVPKTETAQRKLWPNYAVQSITWLPMLWWEKTQVWTIGNRSLNRILSQYSGFDGLTRIWSILVHKQSDNHSIIWGVCNWRKRKPSWLYIVKCNYFDT